MAIQTETHFGAPDGTLHGPNEEQKEGDLEKGNQDREGCVHPLIQGDWSDGSSPRPAGMGLNEHMIKPESLNVADMGAE